MLSTDATKALSILRQSACVHCICHRAPDGDALGALLGMGLLLERHFSEKRVTVFCCDPVPDMFQFLPGVSRIGSRPNPVAGDCIVFLDCAEPKLTNFHEQFPFLFQGEFPSVNIDHHVSNSLFGAVNIVVSDASSTCEILVQLADLWHWDIDADIATCLLTGIYTDTGGLLHSSTTAGVYRAVARLLRSGARHQLMVSTVFRTAKLSTLKLWGRVLEKITIGDEGGVVSAVTAGDFRASGADYSELSGAIDYVNAVPGMRFSLVLSERDGTVKGSLRTLCDDVDVSLMAGRFHGGGHRRAAGFAVPGHLQPEVRWKVVPPDPPSAPTVDSVSP